MTLRKIQPVLAYTAAHLADDVSLATLSRQAGLSVYHLQRGFSAAVGESPKQYTMRLRLGRAAAMLLTRKDTVLDIALSCGFQSHEVFSRAFRHRFGIAPSAYRERGFASEANEDHAAKVETIAPCIGLYRMDQKNRSAMSYSITTREVSPQPVLIGRSRVKRSEIAATIAEILPTIFLHAQKHGIAIAGHPFARYPEVSLGFVTIEPGMPITAAALAPNGNGVLQDTLPGGLAAFTTHCGPYENLPDAYAAIEAWIEAEGLKAAAAPWESYVTDPTDYPDPRDWRTEVFWPVSR